MAKVKFSHAFKDLEKDEIVKAGEEVEYTLKRADEIIDKISNMSRPDYKGFTYERTDKD